MEASKAVLMLAYGGPGSLAEVEPYLLDVRGGRATPPELIEEVRARYAAIGGRSPLLEITLAQANALEGTLNQTAGGYRVYVGMRHWHPYIREAVAQIAVDGITDLTTICMTPFFSKMSTGAYYEHLDAAVVAQDTASPWRRSLATRRIQAWFSHPGFVRALAGRLQAALAAFPDPPAILFTAHSLPAALAEGGDPYADQFASLARLVAEAAGLRDAQWQTCFQSAGAQNTRWLGPALEEVIPHLAAEGQRALLVAPIGFLSDHVEVLYDIDIEAQRIAAEHGVRLARTASLNARPEFIQALAEIILHAEPTA